MKKTILILALLIPIALFARQDQEKLEVYKHAIAFVERELGHNEATIFPGMTAYVQFVKQ